MVIKPTAILQDWSRHLSGPSDALETWSFLEGDCYGHPRINNGDRIKSSKILRFFDDNEKAETVNTIYVLVKKSADYELFVSGYNAEV